MTDTEKYPVHDAVGREIDQEAGHVAPLRIEGTHTGEFGTKRDLVGINT